MLRLTELGTRLKEARLSKGYSLDDLQEITKIQKRYLVAIEEGNYSTMPGTFYVRAFIKQYAEAVGLNAEELLEEYKKEIPQQTEEVAQSISQSPTRRKLNSRTSSRMMESMPKVIVALFIIVIIILIWVLFQKKMADSGPEEITQNPAEFEYDQQETTPPVDKNNDDKTEGASSDTEKDEADIEEDAEETVKDEEVDEEVTQTISEGEIQSDGVTTNYTVTAPTMNIRVEVSGDTWVGIRDANGNEQVDDKTYKTGEKVEFDATANQYARIRLGNSRNAKVFVNDQEIQYAQDIVTQNIVITLSEEQ